MLCGVVFVWVGTGGYNGWAKIREGERRRKSLPMVHQWWQREADAAMRAAAIRRGEARPRCARTTRKEGWIAGRGHARLSTRFSTRMLWLRHKQDARMSQSEHRNTSDS